MLITRSLMPLCFMRLSPWHSLGCLGQRNIHLHLRLGHLRTAYAGKIFLFLIIFLWFILEVAKPIHLRMESQSELVQIFLRYVRYWLCPGSSPCPLPPTGQFFVSQMVLFSQEAFYLRYCLPVFQRRPLILIALE